MPCNIELSHTLPSSAAYKVNWVLTTTCLSSYTSEYSRLSSGDLRILKMDPVDIKYGEIPLKKRTNPGKWFPSSDCLNRKSHCLSLLFKTSTNYSSSRTVASFSSLNTKLDPVRPVRCVAKGDEWSSHAKQMYVPNLISFRLGGNLLK